MISKFPAPWNFKLTWSLHTVKVTYQNSLTTMEVQTDLESPPGKDDIEILSPMELQTSN